MVGMTARPPGGSSAIVVRTTVGKMVSPGTSSHFQNTELAGCTMGCSSSTYWPSSEPPPLEAEVRQQAKQGPDIIKRHVSMMTGGFTG